MKMRVRDLIGADLDAAVRIAQGEPIMKTADGYFVRGTDGMPIYRLKEVSGNEAFEIQQAEEISVFFADGDGYALVHSIAQRAGIMGNAVPIAILRCYLLIKIGEEVNLPDAEEDRAATP